MTLSEAKERLVTRLGWRNDGTVKDLVLSGLNEQSDSGRYFQDEHSAVTLENIRDCQPVARITEEDFNAYLERLRDQAVTQVLSDAFERDYIKDTLLDLYPRAFDTAISLRMVIIIAELIMTSTRSNNIERLSDKFAAKLNYDIFREAPNKFAIRGANYNYTLGAATRYGEEIKKVQRRFGTQSGMMRTVTKGDFDTSQVLFYDKHK